ncbi:hypothetical protein M427DRAFT_131305 [Gonapodya prolifera JEL478]|uniref:SWIRM domain-containing protein n=1 Tax=Gonapodya prolifera (strain JEL478) TaxID=1344416 RepID=A0A139AVL5_GONPJ|nr:hypothetical protein M427DRAFT_131305 [Gonapodya prolifera JEL478]|eukprot:KXS20515.1 hypothetical protein M427DRAFT_131305 [Gonapodya prolifera JEL478]
MTSIHSFNPPHNLMDHHIINFASSAIPQNPPILPVHPIHTTPQSSPPSIPPFRHLPYPISHAQLYSHSSPVSLSATGPTKGYSASVKTEPQRDAWDFAKSIQGSSSSSQHSQQVPNPGVFAADIRAQSYTHLDTSVAVPDRDPSPLPPPSTYSPASGPCPPLPTSQVPLFPTRVMSPEPEALSARASKRRSGSESDCATAGDRRSSDREMSASSGAPPRRKSAKPFRSPSRSSPNPGFKELPPFVTDTDKEGTVVPDSGSALPTILEASPEPPEFLPQVIKLDVFHVYRVRPRTLLYDKKLQKRLREIKIRSLDRWMDSADPQSTSSSPGKEIRSRRERDRRDRERDRERASDRPERVLHNVLYQQRMPSGDIVLTSSRSRQRQFGSVMSTSDAIAATPSSDDGRMSAYDNYEHDSGSTDNDTRRGSISDDQGVALTKIPKRRGRKPNLTRVAAIALHQGAVNVTGLAGIADLINSVAGGSGSGDANDGSDMSEAQRKSSLAALARLQSRPEETAGAPMVSWKGTPLPVTPDMIGYNLLTSEEKRICSILRLYPEQYLKIKETLITAKETRGFFKKREAQKMCRVDVNKTAKIYDWFIALGWLPFGEVHPEEL